MTIYTEKHAAMLMADAGKPWRPSNGHEGEMFMYSVCRLCKVGACDCEINLAVLCFEISDPCYPKEWQIGQDGQPCCTAFVEARA